MPINPSTDPGVYNTSSLKCIRAGLLAWERSWFFFSSSFEFSTWLVSDPRTLHRGQSPHILFEFFPTTLVTLFTCKYPEMKWVAFVVCAGAFPSTAHYLPPHVSVFSFLHPFLAWFLPTSLIPTPLSRCNFTPFLLSVKRPFTHSLSPSLLFFFLPLFPVCCSFPCLRL